MNTKQVLNVKNFGVLVLLTVLAVCAGPVLAVKPTCPSDHPSCADDGGGEPPSNVPNRAWWGDVETNLIFEPYKRFCTTDGGTPTGGSGHYACNPPHGEAEVGEYPISFDLTGGQLTKRGDASLCDSFSGIKTPDYRYIYAWEGPCGADYCDVFVYHTFKGYDNHGIANIGLVHMIAEGFVEAPFDDLNPFAQEQDIYIQEVNITFYADGRSNKLAECRFDFEGGGPVLHTELAE